MNRWIVFLVTGVCLSGLAQASAEMNMENTLSEGAQRNTIAFDGLAFLTGSLGSDSFFPPGKVADFWGFQFLRDIRKRPMPSTNYAAFTAPSAKILVDPDFRFALMTLRIMTPLAT
jgi:hypothetical protein